MSDARPRGRLFRKYVVFLVLLVGGLLLGSGALELYFSYQEAKLGLVRLEREKALAAAERIRGVANRAPGGEARTVGGAVLIDLSSAPRVELPLRLQQAQQLAVHERHELLARDRVDA